MDRELRNAGIVQPGKESDGWTMPPLQGVLFVLFWFGLLAWMVVGCVATRREVAAEIRQTAEYRCLTAAAGKDVRIAWKSIVKPYRSDRSYTAGTLVERPGADCIPDGEAVTFALLPGAGGETLIRIRGRDVETQQRGSGLWADVVGDGGQRWRNDGNGYQAVGD